MPKKKDPIASSRRRVVSPAPVPTSKTPTLIMNGQSQPGAPPAPEPTWREAMAELQGVINARFEALGERIALLEDESCERARAEGKAP